MSLCNSVETLEISSYYNPKLFLTAGALFSLIFLFLFSVPVALALTWNVDFTTVTVNNTVYWDTHPFSYLDDTYYNQSEIDNIIIGNLSANLTDYVPYTGATDDLDLGANDFWARYGNFTVDLEVTDDLFVYDDSFFYDNVDIYGKLNVYDEISHFYGEVRIINDSDAILEIETTNSSESAELHLLADGTNDLYIYTYGSTATATYYGLPKANTSYVDARGERFVLGTFDSSPMYLSTSQNPRFILTSAGDLIPYDDKDYDIGNITNRLRDLYITGEKDNGIHFVEDDGITIGNLSMDDNLNLLWNGNIINTSVTSNSSLIGLWQRIGTTLSTFNDGDDVQITGDLNMSNNDITNVGNLSLQGFTNGSVLYIDGDGKLAEMNDAFYFEPNGIEGKLAIGGTAVMRNIFQAVKSEAITVYDNIKALMTVRNQNTNDGTFAGFSFQTLDIDGDVYSGARIMTNFTNHSDDSISGDLIFDTRHEGVRDIRMIIDSLGNVGIGTTSPDTKFQVVGDTKFGDDNTNYFSTASDGEISLIGTARVIRQLRIGAASWNGGVSAPTEDFEGAFVTLDFDSVSDDEAYFTLVVPYRWDSATNVTFGIDWFYDGVQDDGTVNWALEYKSIKAGEMITGAGTIINQTSTGNHITGQMVRTLFSTEILASNLESGDTIGLRLYRDVSEDTLGADARGINSCFCFIQNKLGQAT